MTKIKESDALYADYQEQSAIAKSAKRAAAEAWRKYRTQLSLEKPPIPKKLCNCEAKQLCQSDCDKAAILKIGKYLVCRRHRRIAIYQVAFDQMAKAVSKRERNSWSQMKIGDWINLKKKLMAPYLDELNRMHS